MNGERVSRMTMRKALRFAAFSGIVFVLPPNALAGPTPTPTPNLYRSLDAGNAHDAGVVRGAIEAVDYANGTISVRSARGVLSIAIVPSTAIYRGGQYATLSDLHRGEDVVADVYTVDGRLIARSINVSK